MNYKLKKWYPSLPNSWKSGMIVSFYSSGNNAIIGYSSQTDGDDKLLHKYEVEDQPDFWEKIEEPKLVSEDGVKYYEKDFKDHTVVWSVGKNNFLIYKNILGTTVFTGLNYIFSTEDAAKKYILWNKPVFTLAEINDIIYNSSILYGDKALTTIRLSRAAESKIQHGNSL